MNISNRRINYQKFLTESSFGNKWKVLVQQRKECSVCVSEGFFESVPRQEFDLLSARLSKTFFNKYPPPKSIEISCETFSPHTLCVQCSSSSSFFNFFFTHLFQAHSPPHPFQTLFEWVMCGVAGRLINTAEKEEKNSK